jgi:uncharacterized protein YkwD
VTRRARGTWWRRALLVTVVPVLAAVLVAAFAREQARADSWYSSARSTCARSSHKMLCYHNQTRRIAGLAALRRGWRLHHAARLKRIRIIRCGHPGHEPCGDSFVRPFYQAHYLPTTCRWLVGENLAWGWSTAWGAFDALMHSPTHRANILDGTFSTYGASHSASPWGRLWVIHYGDRC